jgi:nickel-dependent lactate racemase
VRDALAKLFGGQPLHALARGGDSACDMTCDITRPVSHGQLLQPIVDELAMAGIAHHRITVLVATGQSDHPAYQ